MAAVDPPEALYTNAMAKEKAVHAALLSAEAPLTVLKAVRTVVAQYDLLVRTYPTSGYCDDALWQAGQLSLDAYRKFGDVRDRDTGRQLLRAIASEYRSSKFAARVPDQLARTTVTPEPPPQPLSPPPPPPAPTRQGPSAVARIAEIRDIRRAVLPDVVRVIIELDGEVAFHEERLPNPPRIFIDLTPARATAALLDRTMRFDGDRELVREIRLGRHPNDTTRIVLEAAGVSSFSVYPLYSPYRLVIDSVRSVPATTAATPAPPPPATLSLASRPPTGLRPPTPTPAILPSRALTPGPLTVSSPGPVAALPASPASRATPRPLAAPPATNTTGGFSVARQLGLGVSRVVIDPGHGGHDPGADGGGVTEAELVLDIALRLEKLLARVPGTEVVLTRRTNEFVSLQERTAIANRVRADLFLSIHANASSNKQARGVETYFLNMATSPTAEAVAARENATSGQAMADATKLVNAILQNSKRDESRDLAAVVQRAMVQKLRPANKNVRDLGVKQAPFVVLIGAAMPSVLSEVSFLTNTQDAKLLRTSSYRDRIADALFEAVRSYRTALKATVATAARP